MTRRKFLRWSAAAGLGATGILAYTFEVELHWVAVGPEPWNSGIEFP